MPLINLLFLAPLVACEPAPDVAIEAPAALPPSSCGTNGFLETQLFGSLETSVSWSGSEMLCENMLRPNQEGVRLRFAGDIKGERLAIILSLPDLRRGETAKELPSNVTTHVEGSGRFFSTPNLDTCWTDIDVQTLRPDTAESYTIAGVLYCVAPLGEINGDSAITLPELRFSTALNWK